MKFSINTGIHVVVPLTKEEQHRRQEEREEKERQSQEKAKLWKEKQKAKDQQARSPHDATRKDLSDVTRKDLSDVTRKDPSDACTKALTDVRRKSLFPADRKTLADGGGKSFSDGDRKTVADAEPKSDLDASGRRSFLDIGGRRSFLDAGGRRSNLDSGGRSNLDAGGRSNLDSGGRSNLDSGGRSNLDAGGRSNLDAGGRSNLDAGGRSNLDSGGRRNLDAGGRRSNLDAGGRRSNLDAGGRRSCLDAGGRRFLDDIDKVNRKSSEVPFCGASVSQAEFFSSSLQLQDGPPTSAEPLGMPLKKKRPVTARDMPLLPELVTRTYFDNDPRMPMTTELERAFREPLLMPVAKGREEEKSPLFKLSARKPIRRKRKTKQKGKHDKSPPKGKPLVTEQATVEQSLCIRINQPKLTTSNNQVTSTVANKVKQKVAEVRAPLEELQPKKPKPLPKPKPKHKPKKDTRLLKDPRIKMLREQIKERERNKCAPPHRPEVEEARTKRVKSAEAAGPRHSHGHHDVWMEPLHRAKSQMYSALKSSVSQSGPGAAQVEGGGEEMAGGDEGAGPPSASHVTSLVTHLHLSRSQDHPHPPEGPAKEQPPVPSQWTLRGAGEAWGRGGGGGEEEERRRLSSLLKPLGSGIRRLKRVDSASTVSQDRQSGMTRRLVFGEGTVRARRERVVTPEIAETQKSKGGTRRVQARGQTE
ncbi:hypothetical protein ACOMHN_036682 [Nucella lapillus]